MLAVTKVVAFAYYLNASLSSIALSKSPLNNSVAQAEYLPQLSVTGWDELRIAVLDEEKTTSRKQRYAMGYLEGALTTTSIYNMYENNYADWFGNGKSSDRKEFIYGWLLKNYEWMKEQTKENQKVRQSKNPEKSQLFWSEIGLIITQLEGMVDGYNAHSSNPLTLVDFLLLNADGDIESLMSLHETSTAASAKNRKNHLRCSSFFRLVKDDVFFGHATWDHYDMMVRSLKRYTYGSNATVAFSSSPAFLSSVDDFYLTSQGLAVIETTNGILNPSLWKHVKPESVLSWLRVIVANKLSTNAVDWTTYFSMYNSGTYNNQWMILDTNLFNVENISGHAGVQLGDSAQLLPNTFVVLEQIPGYIEWHDETNTLSSEGYWASYNIPAFPKIWKDSGFDKGTPSWYYSHSECPRAKIFKARALQVDSLESYQRLIRYNDWQNDPFSRGNACNQISARCDLNAVNSSEFHLSGGIDGKASSLKMMIKGNLQFTAQNGPSHDDQSPFQWTKLPGHVRLPKHQGQSDGPYVYPWVQFGP